MNSIKLEIGAVYGRLTVIGNTIVGRYSAAICRCECGTVKTIRRYSLTNSNPKAKLTRSCGCLGLEAARVALKMDRGSAFSSPEDCAIHRKAWLKAYAKVYDARPEQRKLRNDQAKVTRDARTPEQREEESRKIRLANSTPERKAQMKVRNAAYIARPEIKDKLKQYSAAYYKSIKDDPEALKKQNRQANVRYHASSEHFKEYLKARYQIPEIRERVKKSGKASRQKGRDEMTDAYVRRAFIGHSKIKAASIPVELVEVVRVRLQINRQLTERTK